MQTRKRQRKRHIVRRGLLYSLAMAVLILVVGGLGFWLLDPEVKTFDDGLWLAFTTAATVGYGDLVPSTTMARVFAVLVVLLGLAVLSLVTASLAALLVEREVEEEERAIERDLMRALRALRAQVTQVGSDIEALRRGPAPGAVKPDDRIDRPGGSRRSAP